MIRAFWCYVRARSLVAWALDRRELPALIEALERTARSDAGIAEVARATRIAERIVGGSRLGPDTCLYRALARYATLGATGHTPRFVMGIDPHDIDRGHAWVEIDGVPWLERVDVRAMQRTFEHPRRS